jgi:hypothetical protein
MVEIKLSPLAYIDIVRHAHIRPETPDLQKPKYLIYGLLVGSIEEGQAVIKSYIPLFHTEQIVDFEARHSIFHYADRYNSEHYDSEYQTNGIIGFVRSGGAEESFTPIDKTNLLYLQTAYSDRAIAVYVPPDGDQYSMKIKHLKGALAELDIDSEMEDVDWNFAEFEDIDDVFKLVLTLMTNRKKKLPITKELLPEVKS